MLKIWPAIIFSKIVNDSTLIQNLTHYRRLMGPIIGAKPNLQPFPHRVGSCWDHVGPAHRMCMHVRDEYALLCLNEFYERNYVWSCDAGKCIYTSPDLCLVSCILFKWVALTGSSTDRMKFSMQRSLHCVQCQGLIACCSGYCGLISGHSTPCFPLSMLASIHKHRQREILGRTEWSLQSRIAGIVVLC